MFFSCNKWNVIFDIEWRFLLICGILNYKWIVLFVYLYIVNGWYIVIVNIIVKIVMKSCGCCMGLMIKMLVVWIYGLKL